jgi:hypothetical protein
MIQIRQTKQSATVIRLNFVLAHGDGASLGRSMDYDRLASQPQRARRVASETNLPNEVLRVVDLFNGDVSPANDSELKMLCVH